MKILFAMTYFRPYVSGVIIYVENLAQEFVKRGHDVTILTAQYEPGLANEEIVNGVRIVRVPVLFRVSKGVIMPTFTFYAAREIREHDVVAIQVPQFDAPILAILARMAGKPVTMTYHCDVQLPKGLFNRIVDRVLFTNNVMTAKMVNHIIAYTRDYAEHSPLMSRFLSKVEVIPPPVEMAAPGQAAREAFQMRHNLADKKVVGICARFATEKGFEYLIAAIPRLLEEFPNLVVLHAGEFEHVIGEQGYRDRLRPALDKLGDHWVSLGLLGGEELAAFFAACDVTVLPSLNRTESFGFVQIESMLNGTPVVASNLPGVRISIRTTGMGLITPIGDSEALASNLAAILRRPSEFFVPRAKIEAEFSVHRTANDYIALYRRLHNQASHSRSYTRLLFFAMIVFLLSIFLPVRRAE